MNGGDRTFDTSAVRRGNRRTLLDELRRQGTTTKARLAAATGLTVPTVRSLVDELVRCGLAREDAPLATGGPGRPAAVVHYPGLDFAIGVVQFGPSFQRVALSDGVGRELAVIATRALTDPPSAVDVAVGQLVDLAAQHRCRLATTVVIVPGRTDGPRVDSTVLGWHAVPIGDLVSGALSVPSITVNATVAAGHAERHEGVGRTVDRFALLDSGNEVTGVVYVDGRLITSDPVALGELPIKEGVDTTVTDLAGAHSLLARYRASGAHDVDSAVKVFMAALSGDERAVEVSRDAVAALAHCAAWMAALVGPDVLVLGGSLGLLPEAVRDQFTRALEQRPEICCPVVFSTLEPPGWIRGGALLGVDLVREIEDHRIRAAVG